MSITYIPPRVPSVDAPTVEGFLKEDGTVPLTGVWDTGDHNILGPSAIYTSSTAPSAPYTNMLWNDTSISTRIMIRRWSGSAWQVVYGYETAPRTVSLVHDHGALLTGGSILAAYNDIGMLGGQSITITIKNNTVKNFRNASAVNAGSGKVKLPLASGHGFLAGERVCIDGTVNYDGVFVINSVEEGYIIIPATYVAETISASAVVRVVIDTAGLIVKNAYNIILLIGEGFASSINQKQPVVFYSGTAPAPLTISDMPLNSVVRGIKFVAPLAGIVFYVRKTLLSAVEYCAFVGIAANGVLSDYGSVLEVTSCSFKDTGNAAIQAYRSATVITKDNSSVSGVKYGLVADYGGTVKKVSSTQPAGSIANEYAFTSRGGQII